MNATESAWIDCPYCGERIEVVADCTIEHQEYIEDCSVCCRPISLAVWVDEDGAVNVIPRAEDDA